jgi:hypothetical protein
LTVNVAALPPLDTRGLRRRLVAERACNAIRARLLGLQLYAGTSTFSKSVARSRSLSPTVRAPAG